MTYQPDWTLEDLIRENAGVIIDAMMTKGVRSAAQEVTYRMLNIGVKHGKELARQRIINKLISEGEPEIAEIIRKTHL